LLQGEIMEDTDKLTMEQLIELSQGQPAFVPVEQPRNPDGTFAAQNPPEEGVSLQAPPTPEPQADGEPEEELDPNDVVHNGELVHRLETDGEEVYYGHGPDSITRERDAYRQLREAKVHANRKIREQNQQIKAEVEKKAALTTDERYVLSQRLQTEPDLVLNEAVERRLANDPRLKAAEDLKRQSDINAVTTAWVEANPDYYAVATNGKRLWKEMAYNGVQGVPTPADIDRAYQSLKAEGLLQEKPAPAAVVAPVTPAPAPLQRRSSGLSTRSTAVASASPPPPPEDWEKKAREMPLDELEFLINRQARGL
jgi:hypothetical protein